MFWPSVIMAAEEASRRSVDMVGLRPDYAMCNIGLYSWYYLSKNASNLATMIGTTKREAIEAEISGLTASWAENYGWVPGVIDEFKVRGDTYGVGRPRWRRYFGAFDITKWTIFRSLDDVSEGRAKEL